MYIHNNKVHRSRRPLTAGGIIGRSALFILALEVFALVVLFTVIGIRSAGERRLRSGANSDGPSLDMADGSRPADWEEGWIRYDGKVYEYNDNILTFLVLGIDKMEKVSKNPDKVSGGQSDAIFLMVMDTDAKQISLVGINRDTIVDVRMVGVGENGEDIIAPAQLAVQHGFGDGMEGSCELTREAVTELFYGLPIHGYVSFNMGGIAELNDAIGGVDVVVLEDMTKQNEAWEQGAQIRLEGMDAFWYVKWRDTTVYESARGRLARQKQYLGAFGKKAIAATKKDITLPVSLYGKLKDYTVTDISMDEMTYLVSALVNYSFDVDAIYTLEGTTEMGEEFEEFHPDKDALKDLMIRLFYREVSVENIE